MTDLRARWNQISDAYERLVAWWTEQDLIGIRRQLEHEKREAERV